MPYFQGERGRLHYRQWAVADPAAVLVLLPGTGQHSGHYHRFARALGTGGIETWGLDLPGQGLSEGDPHAPGTPVELAPDARELVAIARARRPASPLVVFGHSLGAATAILARPDCAGLVLSGIPRRALTDLPGVAILALHGVDDRRTPIDPVREWSAGRDSTTLIEYPDTGHDVLHEPASRQVTADVVEWILAVGPAT
ncbi:alpha/beta hydrolase [Nocardia pseudobrasiliensis]|uniref:Serine aminopeptidase S33 family n=1 Tax=Nocardia pseudobrasiliensis TaxID=45979 RepID=A0A370ID71_9NOCA|nr:alpha/beta hydrolase [Nocardia pseudobrasiliensis]RDI68646.1 serine aminopeptidase S33 family [Nocardia pseudobrasiliensis]